MNKKTGSALPERSQEGITGNRAVSACAEIPGFASPPRNGFAGTADSSHPNQNRRKTQPERWPLRRHSSW